MPGTYDARTNTVWWGTGNPAPLYDWAGPKWKTEGPRPGDNLYTSSVIGARSGHRQAEVLSPGTAARRLGLRQCGRRVPDDRPRRPRADGASQQGWLRLRLRPQQRARSSMSGALVQNINFVEKHRSEDRRADRAPRHGRGLAQEPLPRDPRRHQLELRERTARRPASTTRSARNGAWTSTSSRRRRSPSQWPSSTSVRTSSCAIRKGGKAHGHVSARDPVTGDKKWQVEFPEPPLSSLLATARQPRLRARCARHASRLRRAHRQGAVVAQQRHWPQRRHHQLRAWAASSISPS